MIAAHLAASAGFQPWRDAARDLLARGVAPGDVDWRSGDAAPGLFDQAPPAAPMAEVRVPAAFVDLARLVACHRDPARFGLLYAMLWRLQGQPRLMADSADPGLRRLRVMAQAVRRDIHHMHAFLRFHEVEGDSPRRAFAAWYEPDHFVLEPATPFFRNRFTDMDWTILTPDARADFRDGRLSFGPGGARPSLPQDAAAELWTTYFSHIFNPARVNPGVMRSHMPPRFWANMPEAAAIPDLIAGAEARLRAMADSADLPARPRADARPAPAQTLPGLAAQIAACRACGCCAGTTQAVCGAGDPAARLMVVGEQPGDHEDRIGQPFVGPAGQVFDRALAAAGIDRTDLWLTNAVKHFKHVPRGKQRLHQTPTRSEIEHCRWWLDAERRLIAPRLTLALGNSAARALTDRAGQIGARRGRIETALDGGAVLLTWHPSAILRQPDTEAAARMQAELQADLRVAADWVAAAEVAASHGRGG
ncbi:UdgX family uracil-DNA binding protein [Paracoccus sp. p4-l81]|uniref:UdgX family uracil-DNA binding protein n=1 Tax=Paracoccus sp. p4-l81 TaxID=3342806 RepID=UPI0035B95A8F